MTTTHVGPRERSPAYRGAQLAFSSPSATQSSPSKNGHNGAVVAANRVGIGSWRATGDVGWDAAAKQLRHDNAASCYIAANIAARLSSERLPLPKGPVSHPSRSRPTPSRVHSDMTMRPQTNRRSINALISCYEGDCGQMSTDGALENRPGKRMPSLNTLGPPSSLDHFTSRLLTLKPHESHVTTTQSRPPSSSSDSSSSYTSATVELLPRLRRTSHSLAIPPAKPPPKPTRSTTTTTINKPILSSNTIPTLSVSSLANAMVASSLASSRAPSPTRPSLPPSRRRSRQHLFHRTHSAENEPNSRTPSPSKGTMRTTMRAPLDPAQDPGVKHRRNHFIHKHPNKHHEGDRKRWRDQITEFERKRYEGVWAANRGMLISSIPFTAPARAIDPANAVLNVIVRDIWSRSQLPTSMLAEIWDLVIPGNGTGAEMLGKEEFVVGMWLVDQALKGRKMPVKVSDSVWFSARGLSGIKVKRRR